MPSFVKETSNSIESAPYSLLTLEYYEAWKSSIGKIPLLYLFKSPYLQAQSVFSGASSARPRCATSLTLPMNCLNWTGETGMWPKNRELAINPNARKNTLATKRNGWANRKRRMMQATRRSRTIKMNSSLTYASKINWSDMASNIGIRTINSQLYTD